LVISVDDIVHSRLLQFHLVIAVAVVVSEMITQEQVV